MDVCNLLNINNQLALDNSAISDVSGMTSLPKKFEQVSSVNPVEILQKESENLNN
jgi:hypothetical protein